MDSKLPIKKILKDIKVVLNRNIYICLYNLFDHIFIKKENSSSKASTKKNQVLKALIDKINNNIILDEKKFINLDYSTKNFDNIIFFVESQNKIFAGDIIEDILISVFSQAFFTDKDNTIDKYIYSNLYNAKDLTNFDIVTMIKAEKLIPNELKNIKSLLLKDKSFDEIDYFQKDDIILLHLLRKIYYLKFVHINDKKTSKTMLYINKGLNYNEEESNNIYTQLENRKKYRDEDTILDKDISLNSIMVLASNMFYNRDFGRIPNLDIKIIRSFLFQVFIYYQNKHSNLMNYTKESQDNKGNKYVKIPFSYNLYGACVEGRFSYIVLSPLKIEPRIEKVILAQNNFRECGMYEIAKILVFNKNIKSIDLNICLIRTNYIEYFNTILGLFNDYSVEVLNLSFNYFKDNSEEFIAKLLTHFRGLKTLNLTSNEFKRGVSSFLIILKNLYRKCKIKLEILMLNKCLLDEASYYELGELIKCKFCKIKKLFINGNSIPINVKFPQKLKKNKNLREVYLNRNDIYSHDAYDWMKVINSTNIRYLYLYKNKISNMNELIRLLYRTKIVKDEKESIYSIIADESYLTNLDLSNNELYLKNNIQIKLIIKLIKETSLNCLEISHILYGANPDRRRLQNDNLNYRKSVEELKKKLEENKNLYYKILKGIRVNTVDRDRNKNLENEEKLKSIKEEDISAVLENEKVKYPVFIKKECRKLADKYFPDDMKDKEHSKEIRNKIENYLVLKKAEKNLKELEELEKAHKLVII